jgi:hypothetical protein
VLIDEILTQWPFDPTSLSARLVDRADGSQVVQMRVELGLLQMETDGRPDGQQPFGARSMLEHLAEKQLLVPEGFKLSPEECFECDREFVQFYHRRICWLELQQYHNASRDARHTLRLMDLCRTYSPDPSWTMTHEQYRPFVLYHRIQAEALARLSDEDAAAAVEVINQGLPEVQQAIEELSSEDGAENEISERLVRLRETLREKFGVGKTLHERLADAIRQEQYELAARLRDEIAQSRPNA